MGKPIGRRDNIYLQYTKSFNYHVNAYIQPKSFKLNLFEYMH